jgi:ribosomal protein S4E
VLLDEIDITNDTVVEIIKFDKNTLMTLVKLHDGRYVIGANVHIDDNMKHIVHVECTNIDDAINTFDNYVMSFGQLVDNSKKW